jgi:hypothetical protein
VTSYQFGYRIVGSVWEERRLVQAAAAFFGYAACDELARVDCEGFLSAFQFGDDFRELLKSTGSCKGFLGACWSPWIWFDIDRADDLNAALLDARRLTSLLIERYRLDDDALLMFYSGAKGLHVGLPTGLWSPEPSPMFHKSAKRFAEKLAELAGVRIDGAVYDRVRAFRAPNSRHPKTGLHKRFLTLEELLSLSLDGIRELARAPAPFDLPPPSAANGQARADWLAAVAADQGNVEGKARRRENGNCRLRLNRSTLDFICNGANEGERAGRLFSAAANLREFGCPSAFAHALLSESALDSGLSPSETRRQIECGLAHVGPLPAMDTIKAVDPPVAATPDLQKQLAELWRRSAPSDTNVPPVIAAAQSSLGAEIIDDGLGDAWEGPVSQSDNEPGARDFIDRGNDAGPYSKEGGRL